MIVTFYMIHSFSYADVAVPPGVYESQEEVKEETTTSKNKILKYVKTIDGDTITIKEMTGDPEIDKVEIITQTLKDQNVKVNFGVDEPLQEYPYYRILPNEDGSSTYSGKLLLIDQEIKEQVDGLVFKQNEILSEYIENTVTRHFDANGVQIGQPEYSWDGVGNHPSFYALTEDHGKLLFIKDHVKEDDEIRTDNPDGSYKTEKTYYARYKAIYETKQEKPGNHTIHIAEYEGDLVAEQYIYTYKAKYVVTKITKDMHLNNLGILNKDAYVADPVNIITGNLYAHYTDLSILSMGSTLQASRYYNSLDDRETSLGKSWRFHYDSYIEQLPNSQNIRVIYPSGRGNLFLYDDTQDNYKSMPGVYDDLKKENDGTYVLTLRNKQQYLFGTDSKLHKIIDPNGNVTDLIYDNNKRLIKVDGGANTYLDIHYNQNNIQSINDSTGRSVTYDYNDMGMLEKVTDSTGESTQYAYEDNRIITIIDKKGHVVLRNDYDDIGRVIKQIDGNGGIINYHYDMVNKTNSYHNTETGEKVTYEYNNKYLITKKIYEDGTYEAYTYDDNGNKTSVRNRNGHVSIFEYDDRNNLIKTISPQPFNYETNMFYNDKDKLIKIQLPNQVAQTFTYDDKGNLLTVNEPIDDQQMATTTYTYDQQGRKLSETNPMGQVIRYTYSDNSPLPITITDAEGHTSTYTYDTANRVKTITKSDTTLTYAYDDMNNITKITDPYGNVTRIKYDSMGNVIKTIRPNEYDSTQDDGIGEIHHYNAMNNRIHTTDAMGHIIGINHYNAAGKVIKAINPNTYNETTQDGEGQRFIYDYNQRLMKTINPSGQQSRMKYDAVGNMLRVITPNNYQEASDNGESLSYTYDALNRLVSVQDKDGQTLTQNIFDEIGQLIKSIDHEGYETLYTYNKAGWLLEKRQPLKKENGITYYRLTKYEYDLLGRITKEFKSNDYVTQTGDADVYNIIYYTYNNNNQIISVIDSTGASTQYDYNQLSQLIKEESMINDDTSRIKRYAYDKLGRLVKEIQVIQGKDIDGSAQEVEEAITTYAYDKNGNLIQVVSPLGYKTNFTYNANNQLIKTKEEVDKDWLNATHVKASIYSPKNKIYENNIYTYDLKVDTDKSLSAVHFNILYDARIFELVDVDQQNENITVDTSTTGRISIDSNNAYATGKTNILSLRLKTKSQVMGLGYITFDEGSYYVEDGNQKKFTELSGQRLNMLGPDYNVNHQVEINDLSLAAKQFQQDGTLPQFKYTYDTNNDGNVDTTDLQYISDWLDNDKSATFDRVGMSQVKNKIIYNDYVKGTEKVIREKIYNYDKAGNLIKETDSEGSIIYAYDVQNNLTKLTDKEGNTYGYQYDEEGNLVKEIKPENYNTTTNDGPATTYQYDYLGRLIRIQDEENKVLQKNIYDRKGRLIKQIDPGGYASGATDESRYKTEYVYDIGGRLIHIISPEAQEQGKANVQYTYDAQDNILSIIDAKGNTTKYIRDLWGRAESITDAAGNISTYTYDYAGNVTSSTDPKGNTTRYHYNSMNKLASIIDPMGQEIHFLYDREGRVVKEVDRLGQVINYQYNSDHNLIHKSIQGLSEDQHYLYNHMGRLFATISNQGIEGYGYTSNGLLANQSYNNENLLSYTYNNNNQVETITDKDNNIMRYHYDVQSRLKSIHDKNSTLATYNYNHNQLDNIAYHNQVNVKYNYNKDNQISQLSHTKDGKNLNTYLYQYDLNGNITEKQENGQRTTYTYDQLNQLTNVIYPNNMEETYRYDIAGNRTQKVFTEATNSGIPNQTTTQYKYNALNQLTKSTQNDIITTYNYDDNGNLLQAVNEKTGTIFYAYDGYNRLTNVTNPDGSYQNNYYTVSRLRTAIEENGVYTGFTYTNGQVISEYTSHGEVKSSNFIGDRLIASKDASGEPYYYQHNSHGDVTSITNQLGKMLNNYTYDAYGNITSREQLVTNRYTYAGEQLDSITGQYYLRARYYDPRIGRFTQEDSFRGDGLNLYAYVKNNPVNYIDPSGNCGQSSNGSTESEYIENQFSQYDIGDNVIIFANNGQPFIVEIKELTFGGEKYKGYWFDTIEEWETFGNANKTYISFKDWTSILIGFTPADIVKDLVDFVKGEDSITGDKINRWLLAAMVITPEAVDIAIKKGAKNGSDVLNVFKKNKNIVGLKKANPDAVINALSDFKGKKMLFGDKTFLLDKSGMKHILERHHPSFWDGSIKKAQSFFDKNMSVDDVSDAIHDIMKQNRDTLINKGTKGMYQIKGTYNGTDYVIGFKNGRVGQFYPE
ncbi:hypothetical protein HZI73_00585 [Vallitalea pronyensis]|uniref:Uncharacterized protein n=1 Tax=Vallitalea pronyensis TaxID=1348613 RepID=A0A8J8SF50_9FIRM|nr:RHS repeat-associated core domain-containing protein [Vallitalea pronyensis]QUI20894.1 hypothetical protein HZI73_00585 [Vallitalea pronyensis]